MYIDPIKNRIDSNELNHHGILGMKWGIRRFQPYPKGEKNSKEVGEADKQKLIKASKSDHDIYKEGVKEYKKQMKKIKEISRGDSSLNFTRAQRARIAGQKAENIMSKRYGKGRVFDSALNEANKKYLRRRRLIGLTIGSAVGAMAIAKLRSDPNIMSTLAAFEASMH